MRPVSTLATLLFISISLVSKAQPNCNYYLYTGDTAQYEACAYVEANIDRYYQFRTEFHEIMDSAIAICPRFAFAHREKAAPYVKSGNFIEWKRNMDSAVKYDPDIYLPIRASVRQKFFDDNQGAIDDINLFLPAHSGDIPYTHNGTYHLLALKAICYKNLGQLDSAISIFEDYFSSEDFDPASYDYLHLGVLYLEIKNYEKALFYFKKQEAVFNITENEFYTALTLYELQKLNKAQIHLEKAEELMKPGSKMHDPYNALADQVYPADILQLKTKLNALN